MQQHIKSVAHERAVETKFAKPLCTSLPTHSIEKGFQKADEGTLEKMDKLFRSAYYIMYLAKNERPFTDFKDILELQNLNGLSLGLTYFNDKAAKEFISNIAGSYFDELKDLLKESKYFSVFCDGTTDKSESEKEIIMVKVL